MPIPPTPHLGLGGTCPRASMHGTPLAGDLQALNRELLRDFSAPLNRHKHRISTTVEGNSNVQQASNPITRVICNNEDRARQNEQRVRSLGAAHSSYSCRAVVLQACVPITKFLFACSCARLLSFSSLCIGQRLRGGANRCVVDVV